MAEGAHKLGRKPDRPAASAWDSATRLKANVERLIAFGKLLRSNQREPDMATLEETGEVLDALQDQLDDLVKLLDKCDEQWCIMLQQSITRARQQYWPAAQASIYQTAFNVYRQWCKVTTNKPSNRDRENYESKRITAGNGIVNFANELIEALEDAEQARR